MILNRRSIVPAVLTAAAVPVGASALGILPRRPEAAEAGTGCEAASLHPDMREALLDRVSDGARVEDLMALSHCPRCGCGMLADMPEDFLASVAR